VGTKYFPDFTGKILLLETPEGESPKKPMPIELLRSLLADLMNLGVWGKVRGMVLGRSFGYEGEELRSLRRWLLIFVKWGRGGNFRC
jgi:muramoyltetrapeptide carboxypeptidase LdcA involved in peptidoglycan recycling